MTSALYHFAHLNPDPEAADVDYRQVQSCRGKERYSTPQLAIAVAERRNRRSATGNRDNRAPAEPRHVSHYRCRWCEGWHLGTNGKLRGVRK